MTIQTHIGRSYRTEAVMVNGRRRIDFVLTCGLCGGADSIHLTPNCPPAHVLRKFERRGWLVNPVRADWCTCPKCVAAKKERKMVAKPDLSVVKPADPTLEQIGRIAAELRECFDADAGAYIGDESDKSVGKKVGLPWGIVAKVRETLGLKIKVDPEVQKLRDDVAALEGMLADVKRRLAALDSPQA